MGAYLPKPFLDSFTWRQTLKPVTAQKDFLSDMKNQISVSETSWQYLDFLRRTIHDLNTSLSVDAALSQILLEIKQFLQAESVSLLLYDTISNKLTFSALTDSDAQALLGQKLPSQAGLAWQALHERQTLWIAQAQVNPHFYPGIDELTGLTTRSLVAVPLLFREKPLGVIEAINLAHPQAFDLSRLTPLETLAEVAAIALHHNRLTGEIERQTDHFTVLHELDQAITISLRLPDIYHAFASHAARLLPYNHLAVALLEEGAARLTYVTGDVENLLPVGTILPQRNSLVSWVTTHGQPLLRHDIATTPRFTEDEQLVAMGLQSTLTIPLRAKGRVIGVWNLSSAQKSGYHPDDLNLAQAMADQLAVSVENARLFEQVRASREQMRHLAQQIVSAQEKERQRLSQELHDEAGQALTALKIGLELVQGELPATAQELIERLGESIDLTDITMEKLRLLARDLRPSALDTAGLSPTLAGLCRDFARRTQLVITYHATDLPAEPLPDTINICLYRFLQETLTNVAKHAQANRVKVNLRFPKKEVTLTVQDDGRGFEKKAQAIRWEKPRGIGLLGLQERLELLNGWLELESQPGQGTCLVAHIPLDLRHER